MEHQRQIQYVPINDMRMRKKPDTYKPDEEEKKPQHLKEKRISSNKKSSVSETKRMMVQYYEPAIPPS